MKRTILTIATLGVLATATAFAAEIVKKDDIVQLKPPPGLRTDLIAPGLRDSLTTVPSVDTNIDAAQSGAPDNENSLQGKWSPPPAESLAR